ncbi:MAG: hypothetical protein SFU27_03305 [Thermonemataceae bacterium]|nr:hypothetical protein [Thermonemataceae bacterium]
MKNKLKKLGVLAVLLANVAIFAPQKAEGQGKVCGDCNEVPKPKLPGKSGSMGNNFPICYCDEGGNCKCQLF